MYNTVSYKRTQKGADINLSAPSFYIKKVPWRDSMERIEFQDIDNVSDRRNRGRFCRE